MEWKSCLGTKPVHLSSLRKEETASPLLEVFHVDWLNLLSFHVSQIYTQFAKYRPVGEITLDASHAVRIPVSSDRSNTINTSSSVRSACGVTVTHSDQP